MTIIIVKMATRMDRLLSCNDGDCFCTGVCEQLSGAPIGGKHFQGTKNFESSDITCTGTEKCFFLKADGDHNMIPKMDLPEKHKFVQLSKIDPEAFRGLEDTLQVGIFTIQN